MFFKLRKLYQIALTHHVNFGFIPVDKICLSSVLLCLFTKRFYFVKVKITLYFAGPLWIMDHIIVSTQVLILTGLVKNFEVTTMAFRVISSFNNCITLLLPSWSSKNTYKNYVTEISNILNPFQTNFPFLYAMKTLGNLSGFCFQGV